MAGNSLSSKTKSTQATTNNQETTDITTTSGDNRVTDSGIIGGNVTTGATGGDVNVQLTDFGALAAAERLTQTSLRNNQTMNMAALDFGSDALESMGDVSRDAIYSNQDISEAAIDLSGYVLGDSLRFGESVFNESMDFGSRIVDTLDSTNQRAMEFGQDALVYTGDSILEATQSGLDFGYDVLDRFQDAQRDADNRAYNFAESAQVDAFDFAFGVLEGVGSSNAESISRVFDFASDTQNKAFSLNESALGYMGESAKNTIDTMADNFQFWSEQTSQNTDRALAFATRANTSENTQVVQDFMKQFAIVAGIVGLVIVFKGNK